MNDEYAYRYISAHVRMHGGKPAEMSMDELLDCYSILPPPLKTIEEFIAAIDPKEGNRMAVDALKNSGIDGVTVERSK